MDLGTLKALFRKYDFRPKKRLGQNFLVSRSVAERILQCFGETEEPVVEIGGGFGALTGLLAESSPSVYVLEPDPVLYGYLSEKFQGREGVWIEKKDILKTSFKEYAAPKARVIGNLPYAITSPILIHLVNERRFLEEAVVTVQEEVAERLKAKPRTKAYSPLSCLLQCFAEITALFKIPPGAFYPRSKVDSRVVRIRFLIRPAVAPRDLDFMFQVIRAGFGKRRKLLANALQDLGLPKEKIVAGLEEAGFSKGVRAEELELSAFARLSDQFQTLTRGKK